MPRVEERLEEVGLTCLSQRFQDEDGRRPRIAGRKEEFVWNCTRLRLTMQWWNCWQRLWE